MKQIPLLLALLMFTMMHPPAQAQDKKPPLLQEIFYIVDVQEENPELAETQHWHNNLQPAYHEALVGRLLGDIIAGKLKVNWPQHPFKTPMTSAEVKNIVTSVDSIYVEDTATGKLSLVAQVKEMDAYDITALGFHESWHFDSIAKVLDKEVRGIVLYGQVVSSLGEEMGVRPLFYLPLNSADIAALLNTKKPAVPVITYDMRIRNFDPETRELSWWENNLEPSKRHAFVSSIYTAALMGKVQAYEAVYPYDKKITPAQVDAIRTRMDTIEDYDPYTGDPLLVAIKSQVPTEEINWVRFHEEWYFDHARQAMHKRVLGFALMQDDRNYAGELNMYSGKPLFYVKGNDRDDPSRGSYSTQQMPGIPLLQEIEYSVRTYRSEIFDGRGEYMHQRLEPSAHYKLIAPLLSKVKSGDLIAYSPNDRTTPLTRAELEEKLFPVYETDVYEDPYLEPVRVTMKDEITDDRIFGIRFYEEWHFDTLSNSLQKKIKGIYIEKQDGEIGEIGRTLFYLPLKQDDSAVPAESSLVTQLITYDVHIRHPEEDIRENMWWYDNLEPSKRELLLGALFGKSYKGQQAVYSAELPNTRRLTKGDIISRLLSVDTVLIEELETGKIGKQVVTVAILQKDITALRFHEAWYFDHAKMVMQKAVKGVTLIAEKIDENGVTASNPLFYVPLNGHVPVTPKKPAQVIVPRISYVSTADIWDPTVKGIDTARFVTQLNKVLTDVEKGQKTAYLPASFRNDPPMQTPMMIAEWKRQIEGVDTVLIEVEAGPPIYRPVPWKLPASAVRGVLFNESWIFDPAEYTFTKKVSSIDVCVKDERKYGLYISLFTVPVSEGSKNALKNKDILLGENIQSDVEMTAGTDGFYSYENWWMNCLELSKRLDIIQRIINDVSSGKVKAYDPVTLKKLDKAGAKKQLTVPAEVYENDKVTYIDQPLDHMKVYGLRFHEEWYFDAASGIFAKKVKGLWLMTRYPGKEVLLPAVYIKMN